MTYDKWEQLKIWLLEQKDNRRFAGDAYRFTAYEAVLKKMEQLEEGENESLVEYLK